MAKTVAFGERRKIVLTFVPSQSQLRTGRRTTGRHRFWNSSCGIVNAFGRKLLAVAETVSGRRAELTVQPTGVNDA